MTSTKNGEFSSDDYWEQAREISYGAQAIWFRIGRDIADGLFDRDPNAKAQAESLFRDAQKLDFDLIPF